MDHEPDLDSVEPVPDDDQHFESGDEEQQEFGPKPISARGQIRKQIFLDYVTTQALKLTKESLRKGDQSQADDRLSIRDLLAREESQKITTPREYQTELYERAKSKNIIAVLDTGSGKTQIAVLLMKHILEQEVSDRAVGKPARIACFLVHSVALVMQQHSVLSENLPHPVEPLCGAMNVDLWTKAMWDKHFAENKAFVCTAEVLHQCLYHGFIRVDQINLLVFDEAHHAKKDHPYAKIIRDFYLAEDDQTKRPKIFGMTASPVDVKVEDVRAAAMDLERLLQAQIATTSNPESLQAFVTRPQEQVATFYLQPASFATPFHQQMHARFGHVEVFKKLFDMSRAASRELGQWSADIFWETALTEMETKKKERKTERLYRRRGNDEEAIAKYDDEIAKLQEAAELVQGHSFGKPQLSEPSLSNKVIVLLQYLQQYFDRPSDARCIVFVERRITAKILTEVFTRLGSRPKHLRPGMLVGSIRSDDVHVTFRQQFTDLQKFRKGEINCLFSTSIAEEGLDIPACNLVVRFDLYTTMIQYVQSRGRARHLNSKYLHMIEHNNAEHKWTLQTVRQSEKLMREFCEALPEDRKLTGNDDDDGLVYDRMDGDFAQDATTKAKLTLGAVLAVLAHFVSSLPNENEESLQPLYNISAQSGLFVCEIVLPAESPVRSVIGEPKRRKALAKRSAALKLCKALRSHGALDQNWLPTYTKKLHAFRNAQLAVSSNKSNMYPMQTKPSLWKSGTGDATSRLYLTVIDVLDELDRPHHPIGLLTRRPLPELPRFPLFMTSGKETEVIVRSISQPMLVDTVSVSELTKYTLRAWLDIWNKEYEEDADKMSYWIAPLLPLVASDNTNAETVSAKGLIDWTSVTRVIEHDEYPWTPEMTASWLVDKFMVDRWDGGRRFFVQKVMPKLTPQDPVPSDAVKLDKYSDTILNYTVRLWKKSREGKEWEPNQPVLLVEQMLHRQNLLAPPVDKEKALRTRAYVCPQPLKISALSSAHVTMLLVFPPILYRIEQYLIALESFDSLGLQVGAKLALEAMTKDSDNSDDRGEQQVNFRPGMGANYERLEFLGDCFLKMATTLPLYAKNISNQEEIFHIERMLMLCNQNLYNTAVELELYKFVRSMAFSRRTWYPEGLKLLKGKGHEKRGDEVIKHQLGDKTVADVCEASIGAVFLQHNVHGAWKPEHWTGAVTAVTKLVNNSKHEAAHTALQWSDYYASYEFPTSYEGHAPASWLEMAHQIEQVHQYRFKNVKILRSAFTHGSMGNMSEGIPTYERLEFLGDALLDLACVTHLFYNHPTRDPQWLTEHKSAIASNKFLGALCVKLGFHRHLKHSGATNMVNQITSFATETREAEKDANGSPDYWCSGSTAPKCLPDIVEAYIGAVFVDSGFNYNEVQRFFNLRIKPYFEDMTLYDKFASNHPSARLSHRLGKELGCRDYFTKAYEIPPLPGQKKLQCAMVMVHNNIIAHSVGESSRYAKERATAKAHRLVDGLSFYEYKERYGCDCKEDDGDQDADDHGTAV